MLKISKYRRALLSDYLSLMLCAFTLLMLLYSGAINSVDPFDSSTAAAELEETAGVDTVIQPAEDGESPENGDLGTAMSCFDIDGKAVKA